MMTMTFSTLKLKSGCSVRKEPPRPLSTLKTIDVGGQEPLLVGPSPLPAVGPSVTSKQLLLGGVLAERTTSSDREGDRRNLKTNGVYIAIRKLGATAYA